MEYFFSKKTFRIGDSKIEKNDVGKIIKEKGTSYEVVFIKLKEKHEIPIKDVETFDISKAGDRYQKKVCDRCFKFLDMKMFSGNRLKKGDVITHRPSCKDCRKLKDGVKIPKETRKEWEPKRPKQYSLFQCPICKKTTIVGKSKIVLDHNHQTGDVRGYLCESCNTGIGRFDDDPEIIKNAIKWLKNN